jgi:uroporphyrinogen decarboxylase
MNKRDLIFSLLDPSGTPAYTPAAFFLHFDPAYHTGRPAVEKHLEYFRFTGMDFVKIQFELPFPEIEIKTPADWEKMPFLDLDHYRPALEVVNGLVAEARSEAPVILTLYSPYMLTNNMAGDENVTRTMHENPQAYQRAIGKMTDSLMQFVKEAIRLGLDGFYTSTQGGEKDRLPDPSLFDTCIRPYDLAIMEEINRSCPFNILHICDYHLPYDDIEKYIDYPGHVVNVSLDLVGKDVSVKDVAKMFNRPFMGGLNRKAEIARGTPEQIRTTVKQVLASAPERFILGADCTVPADTPWENLRTAIQTAHENKKSV